MRIGFIGLGIMGGPMAANLVKAGHAVTGHNRSRAAVQRLVAAGGGAASTVADAVRDADVIITMLPDSPDVEQVALGEILPAAQPDALYIDMSTVRPQTSVAVAHTFAARGIRTLDAPVSGGEQGAIDATLSIMVGGSPEAFGRARPVLDALGTTIEHVGPDGAGQTVKAANQLVVAGTIELVAEAIVLLDATGVDVEAGLRVLGGGLAGNRIIDRRAESMLARRYEPGFRVDLHHKDLGIGLEVARDAGVVVPLGAVVAQLMAAVRARGDGALDHTALLKLVEALSGRTR
ncbi:2-hydroxy-3-oxopropionate reductase [Kutzneria buriramensis]|uniref:2-hydroxy-3-oxopropionate reductase n=1 Tax=Kutzneria buriramensis TaxID=1045776 RepID=A0A3E0HIS2_9PSEU|nr:2-hydroxy-3-oxopropionate reductase [Kutzneria buriramensis]REH46292.1 2-hydroxy-3-oxopropionate reductase [Kutzneria buriramensis]